MMDFIETSLATIGGLSIHWSSDCNMACKYCYIEKDKQHMAGYNRAIREALENKTFINNIRRVFDGESRNNINNIALWGAEPTINAKYFAEFSHELLDHFPNCETFMFSTNALLGADCLYGDFVIPLMEYAESHKRPISFELQFSLDGPPEFNDDSRHPGATASTLNAIMECAKRLPEDLQFFTLKMHTKATLDVSYMRIMLERGLPSFKWYYKFFNDIQLEAEKYASNKRCRVALAGTPTIVDPGYYTKDDGITFAKWLNMMRQLDVDDLPCYCHDSLFMQALPQVGEMLEHDNPVADAFYRWSCSAGKNNITIDYEGNLYSCNRLCKNSAIPGMTEKLSAMKAHTNIHTVDKKWIRKTWGMQLFHHDLLSRRWFADCVLIPMALAGQINPEFAHNEEMRNLLYMFCCGVMCHVGIEEEYTKNAFVIPASYARLFGNGAMEEFLKYEAQLENRGVKRKWNIAM